MFICFSLIYLTTVQKAANVNWLLEFCPAYSGTIAMNGVLHSVMSDVNVIFELCNQYINQKPH